SPRFWPDLRRWYPAAPGGRPHARRADFGSFASKNRTRAISLVQGLAVPAMAARGFLHFHSHRIVVSPRSQLACSATSHCSRRSGGGGHVAGAFEGPRLLFSELR